MTPYAEHRVSEVFDLSKAMLLPFSAALLALVLMIAYAPFGS
ncbi:MAG: hypothetical protein ACYCWW_04185 [Deltaproteobacteria bacterium]